MSDFQKLKEKGDNLYKKENYEDAHEYYASALAIDPSDPGINVRMAKIYLDWGDFENAYWYAERAKNSPSHKKAALIFCGRAACAMENFDLARKHFDECFNEFKCKSLLFEILNTRIRTYEKRGMAYNCNQLFVQAHIERKFDIPFKDYYGPIEIFDSKVHGKGIRIIKDVPQGTILMAENCFATGLSAPPDDNNPLLLNLLKRLKECPQLNKFFMVLHAGPNPEEHDAKIRVKQVMIHNAFGLKPSRTMKLMNKELRLKDEKRSGLSIMACFYNHSCLPNVNITTFGDVIVITALYDLKAGDELFTSYVEDYYPIYNQRKVRLATWGIECNCKLCQVEKADQPEIEDKRNEMLKRLKDIREKSEKDAGCAVRDLKPMIDAMAQSYAHRRYPIHLITLLDKLLTLYEDLYRFHRDSHLKARRIAAQPVIDTSIKIMDLCKDRLNHYLEGTLFIAIIRASEFADDHQFAVEWTRRLYEWVKNMYGIDDKNLFEQMYLLKVE